MEITVPFAARVIETMRSVAAREIVPRFRTVAATHKDDGSLVTEADLIAQQVLVKALHAIHDVPVLAEEMPREEQLATWERGGRYWCVDPLDGTRNFAHGVPHFALSVALMQDDRALFGAIHDPIAGEAFYAVHGGGAWLDHRPLAVPAQAPALSQALAEVSLRRDANALRSALKHRAPYRRRLTSGCATLAWCHLAAARTDVMITANQKMWDYAAGALIAEEAGARVSALEHDDFWAGRAWTRSAIAARGDALMEEWKSWVRRELRSSCTPR